MYIYIYSLVNDVFGSDRVQMEKVMMLLWQFRDDPSVVQFMAQFVAKVRSNARENVSTRGECAKPRCLSRSGILPSAIGTHDYSFGSGLGRCHIGEICAHHCPTVAAFCSAAQLDFARCH